MRILHVYKDYFPVLGGMENHIKTVAEAQAAGGNDVTVLVTGPSWKTSTESLGGVRVVKAGRMATVASTPLSISLPLCLRRERPDIVHLHHPYPVGEVAQLVFSRGTATILTYHSDIVRQKTYLRFYRPWLRRLLKRVDGIIATSDRYIVTSEHLRPFADKCRVIPLGIDLEPFLRSRHDEAIAIRRKYGTPLLVFVGKLRYYKGLQYLVQAMEAIPARLLVVGSGPMAGPLAEAVRSMHLEKKVIFLGELPEAALAPYYQAADIFVLPASERSEAYGLVQVEAMASGVPVISTELGTGTSFVNVHGKTGLVVAPKDPGALRDAAEGLLADPLLRKGMGEEGRKRAVTEFAKDRMVDRIGTFYSDLLRVNA